MTLFLSKNITDSGFDVELELKNIAHIFNLQNYCIVFSFVNTFVFVNYLYCANLNICMYACLKPKLFIYNKNPISVKIVRDVLKFIDLSTIPIENSLAVIV